MPIALIDELLEAMRDRLEGTREARSCAGLSFRYEMSDRPVRPARYEILDDEGHVQLTRADRTRSTFAFRGSAEAFDAIFLGRSHALGALLSRRISMSGSMFHVRSVLRFMPAVQRAYRAAREELIAMHSDQYDFRLD